MKEQKNSTVKRLAYALGDAAAMIGVSKNHLWNEYKRGKLRLIKSGRRTLVTDVELRRYLAETECRSK